MVRNRKRECDVLLSDIALRRFGVHQGWKETLKTHEFRRILIVIEISSFLTLYGVHNL